MELKHFWKTMSLKTLTARYTEMVKYFLYVVNFSTLFIKFPKGNILKIISSTIEQIQFFLQFITTTILKIVG